MSRRKAEPKELMPIGSAWNEGIYAGRSIFNNETVVLLLLPGDKRLNWNEAQAWAEEQGGVLPSRFDQLVLFKNLKGQFQPDWYWSDEQYASTADFAWVQSFDDGAQDTNLKPTIYGARAVRRLPL